VACAVVVKRDDKEVARVSRTLGVNDPVAELPRDPGQMTVTPPALDGDKVVKTLPSTFDDLAVGGGGRFLILHLDKIRKLACFDVNEAKVVKYIDLPEDNVKFAAGQDVLLIGLPGAKPADAKAGEVDVLLSVADAGGQECFQSYKATVGE
jgi:hypothetical protein